MGRAARVRALRRSTGLTVEELGIVDLDKKELGKLTTDQRKELNRAALQGRESNPAFAGFQDLRDADGAGFGLDANLITAHKTRSKRRQNLIGDARRNVRRRSTAIRRRTLIGGR